MFDMKKIKSKLASFLGKPMKEEIEEVISKIEVIHKPSDITNEANLNKMQTLVSEDNKNRKFSIDLITQRMILKNISTNANNKKNVGEIEKPKFKKFLITIDNGVEVLDIRKIFSSEITFKKFQDLIIGFFRRFSLKTYNNKIHSGYIEININVSGMSIYFFPGGKQANLKTVCIFKEEMDFEKALKYLDLLVEQIREFDRSKDENKEKNLEDDIKSNIEKIKQIRENHFVQDQNTR